MRKTMTREITSTNVKLASIELVEGKAELIELPSEKILGNVDLEKAQKLANKKFDRKVTVLAVEPETTVYEMDVELFMELASVKEEEIKEA